MQFRETRSEIVAPLVIANNGERATPIDTMPRAAWMSHPICLTRNPRVPLQLGMLLLRPRPGVDERVRKDAYVGRVDGLVCKVQRKIAHRLVQQGVLRGWRMPEQVQH